MCLLLTLPCCNNICGVNWSFPSKKLLQKVDLSIWLLDRQARTPICNEKNVKMKLTDTKRNKGKSFLMNTFTCVLLCFHLFNTVFSFLPRFEFVCVVCSFLIFAFLLLENGKLDFKFLFLCYFHLHTYYHLNSWIAEQAFVRGVTWIGFKCEFIAI